LGVTNETNQAAAIVLVDVGIMDLSRGGAPHDGIMRWVVYITTAISFVRQGSGGSTVIMRAFNSYAQPDSALVLCTYIRWRSTHGVGVRVGSAWAMFDEERKLIHYF